MARAPQAEIGRLRQRLGWSVPWYSSYGSSFNEDMGLTAFGLSVLLRDGDEVFRTYFTTARGVDRLRLDFNLLDLTSLRAQGAVGGLAARLAAGPDDGLASPPRRVLIRRTQHSFGTIRSRVRTN